MVGDFFLKEADREWSTDGDKLTVHQKTAIDSILIFDKNIVLEAKQELLRAIKPKEKYYLRIHQMAVEEKNSEAVVALSKYKKAKDISFFQSLLNDSNEVAQYYGLNCLANFSVPSVFPRLQQLMEIEANDSTSYTMWQINNYVVALYKAVVQYKNPESRKLLEKVLQNAKGEAHVAKTDMIFQALKAYPDKIYEGLVPFNFYQ